MAKKIKWKVNEWGESVTKCPNGFKKFTSGAPKFVGSECLLCKYRKNVDFDNKEVECLFVRKRYAKNKK